MFLRNTVILANELISKIDYEKVRLVVSGKIRIPEMPKHFLVAINLRPIRGIFSLNNFEFCQDLVSLLFHAVLYLGLEQ